jgi:hypothetical protein
LKYSPTCNAFFYGRRNIIFFDWSS